MTPQEFKFLVHAVESASKHFYEQGHKDAQAKTRLADHELKMTAGARLVLLKGMKDSLKTT